MSAHEDAMARYSACDRALAERTRLANVTARYLSEGNLDLAQAAAAEWALADAAWIKALRAAVQ